MSSVKFRTVMISMLISKLVHSIDYYEQIMKNMALYYAYIIHDKDDAEPHLQFVMQFKNPVSVNSIAKRFEIESNLVQNMAHKKNSKESGFNNALSHLVHQTMNASEKYQYKSIRS